MQTIKDVIFKKSRYAEEMSRDDILESIKKEGFNPLIINDPPGRVYEEHSHPETKLLACLEGFMSVTAGGENYNFEVGDKLVIPGNIPHSAIVGDEGCTFFWSEKVI